MVIRACFFVFSVIFSGYAISDDFRGFNWGASESDVKKLEKATFQKSNDEGNVNTLIYNGEISGVKVIIYYIFSKNRLVSAIYKSYESHLNRNSFISDFEYIKNLLQKKYGTPKLDEITGDDLFKDDSSNRGIAVATGLLKYIVIWETDRTKVYTSLYGDNLEITHTVLYEEKASSAEREKDKEKQVLDQL